MSSVCPSWPPETATGASGRPVSRKATEAMIHEAHEAAGGHPYIELMVSTAKIKSGEPKPALDRKSTSSIAKWLKERAFPKK